MLKFVTPKSKQVFEINTKAEWPSIEFQTDGTGSHKWTWSIKWDNYSKNGTADTADNKWVLNQEIENYGGTLKVTATCGKESATIEVSVHGKNPTKAEALEYLATKGETTGYDKLLEHESHFSQFRSTGLPVKSFDNGYGMGQLTTPAPTAEQVWNWKKNIDGGLTLFGKKIDAARAHLGQSNRSYTTEQLRYEAVCRYNGGAYHKWDDTKKAWVRNPNIVCDTQTSNRGWDMTDEDNKGKTEAELRKRDKDTYDEKDKTKRNWGFFGVCYADRILGTPSETPAAPAPAPAAPATNSGHSLLWLNQSNEICHPNSPAGAGGSGYFREPLALTSHGSLLPSLPHPWSPACQSLDPLKITKNKS